MISQIQVKGFVSVTWDLPLCEAPDPSTTLRLAVQRIHKANPCKASIFSKVRRALTEKTLESEILQVVPLPDTDQ
jgi:tRNA pseudouridine-54 N-methylase